jgi:hypothetical protein
MFTMVGAVALSLLAGDGVSSAQQAFTATTAPALVVKLSVVAAPGVSATVALRNGEMGRWTMTDGSQYGLTPVIADGVSQLYIFQITPGKTPSAERLQQMARRTLFQDKPAAYPEADPLFEVTLLGTSPIPARATQPPGPDAPCTRGCVTCDGVTACACAVQMDCGSCCCQEHCTCFNEVSNTRGCAAPLPGTASSRTPAQTVVR